MSTPHTAGTVFSEPLRNLVTRKFLRARASKDLIFSDTYLAVLPTSYKTPLQLRCCPALAQKPTKDNQLEHKEKAAKKPFDPFENPSTGLLVTEIPVKGSSHNIILNKYPVIPNHFILATKENKAQTDLLEEDDLYLSHACLHAWEDTRHSLFAFFNSGDHSGASQAHRHLQFLPVEDMIGDTDDDWVPLCNTMNFPTHGSSLLLHNPTLPVVHFAVSLEDNPGPTEMLHRYHLLLKAGLAKISGWESLDSLDTVVIHQHGKTAFSYNLAMTTKLMAILPRKSESSQIGNIAQGTIDINGTILAGTMMVKAEEEWQQLRQDPSMVQQILQDIAFPSAGQVSSSKRENL